MIVFGSEPFGAHYEVTSGVVTKYYYAGAQRIAMRQDGELFFIIGDHLGSTSIVTDANGTKVSEIRYKAWGEVRYESGASPTEYTYTGQYSYTADFGLMFYNARWYDPYLNHFTQPDSIVPNPYNSQDYDRYAYARNNPMRYTDPSGHCAMDDSMDDCYSSANRARANDLIRKTATDPRYGNYALKAVANLYGLKLSPADHWEYESQTIVDLSTRPDGTFQLTAAAGRTPKATNEQITTLNNGVLEYWSADDTAVYISGFAFNEMCSGSDKCIAGIMAHEATHSWIEYLAGGNAPSPQIGVNLNEEIIADTVSLAVIGDTRSLVPTSQHKANIEYSAGVDGYSIDNPFGLVGSYYQINNLTEALLVSLVSK